MINNQVWVFAVPCKEAKHKGRYSYLIATEKIREIGSLEQGIFKVDLSNLPIQENKR